MRKPIQTLCVAVFVALLSSCTAIEEKRIRELLNEKGFGTRAQGIAPLENYISGGDAVVFFLDPTVLVQPGFEQLALLATPQQIGIDGTIHIPYVGNVMILGLTERELEDLVTEQLRGLFTEPLELTARIINTGKAYYVFGESVRKGRMPMTKGDLTILEAISTVGTTVLANTGRINLIRPDAQNPMVMEINFREMVLTGNTTFNVLLQDNDVIYIPPTALGTVTRFVQKLLQPLNVVTRALFAVSRAELSYDRAFGF